MTTTQVSHEVDEKIIVRIQKLLSLAEHENSNVGEAGNAAAKVQELLDAYNLEMAQVLAYDTGEGSSGIEIIEVRHSYGPYFSALNKGWQAIMRVVAKQYNCTDLLTSGWDEKTEKELARKRDDGYSHKRVAKFIIIGEKTNVETAIAVFDWLKQQLDVEASREWPRYRDEMKELNRSPGDPIPFRLNFFFGAADEIRRIMSEKREERENYSAVTALAIKYDELNQEYVNETYGELVTTAASQAQANGYAYRRGREAGGRIERQREGSVNAGARSALPA